MKSLNFSRLTFLLVILLFVSCAKDESPLSAKLVVVGNREPTANYVTEFDVNYPRTDIVLTSTSSDPEDRIAEYWWLINGVKYSGQSVTVSFDQPGEYSVTHFVRDEESTAEKTGLLHVSNFPTILIRLLYLAFSNNNGDGANKVAHVYSVVHSIATNSRSASQVQQYVYPSRPGNGPFWWTVIPYEQDDFGANSGYIMFSGSVTDFVGLSIVFMDHDERGFNWGGFFSKLLGGAAAIVSPWFPTAGAVLGGLSKISSMVGDFLVKEPQDDVIARFEKVHTPKDRWGIDQIHYATNGAVTIRYSIETIP